MRRSTSPRTRRNSSRASASRSTAAVASDGPRPIDEGSGGAGPRQQGRLDRDSPVDRRSVVRALELLVEFGQGETRLARAALGLGPPQELLGLAPDLLLRAEPSEQREQLGILTVPIEPALGGAQALLGGHGIQASIQGEQARRQPLLEHALREPGGLRSEERRVGTEWRCGGSACAEPNI